MSHRALAWPYRAALWLLLLGACHATARGQSPGRVPKARSASSSARQEAAAPATPPGTMKFRVTRRAGLEPDQPAGDPTVASSDQVFALDPAGADWTLSLSDKAEVEISYKGTPVIKSSNVFVAGQGKPVTPAPTITVPSRGSNRAVITGAVEGFGLRIKGRAMPISPHELRIELDIDAQKPMKGLFGGGLAWSLELDSPVFREKAGEPKLLLDRSGWRWPVRTGQEVMVRFDAPLATLAFVKDQKKEIRTFFVGEGIRPGHGRISLTVSLPETGRVIATTGERYANPNANWFRGALPWDAAPVDLTFLNAADRPAGRHGRIKARGDQLVLGDGTPARFWGANLSGPVLFSTPRGNIPGQARRIAQLGYNLIRIQQHDSDWVVPNIFGANYTDTRHLDPKSLDALDLWIKCLEDQGIYVWLDLHWRRPLKPRDGLNEGYGEIGANQGLYWGYSYVNPNLVKLMSEFQHQYLNHVNRYTGKAYKNDPAVIGVTLTNENDLMLHFGIAFLPGHNNPVHKGYFDLLLKAFSESSGLPADRLSRTWEPGPSKYFLFALEHRFNRTMIDELKADGVHASIATTCFWGPWSLFMLPSLTDGDLIDVHSYGESEALSADPRYRPNFISAIAAGQVYGKPLTITEWNVHYPHLDRFTAPLYVASIASLQGWDAPMIYNYSQTPLQRPGPGEWHDEWSSFCDPAITGVMPAAAVAFRQGHISPARATYCLKLSPAQLFETNLDPTNAATVRTLAEQSRLTIGIPAVKELPWLKPSEPSASASVNVVTDPDHDFIPAGQSFVKSDTGELTRNWIKGIQTIDTPKTQAVSGWIGGKNFPLQDASFEFSTRKAVVALTSIDGEPLVTSRFILVTTIAQARSAPPQQAARRAGGASSGDTPFVTEPVVGKITLRTKTSGLELLSLGPDGRVVSRTTPSQDQDAISITLPAGRGTHWYALMAAPAAKSPPQPANP